jgi:hypothetical protein
MPPRDCWPSAVVVATVRPDDLRPFTRDGIPADDLQRVLAVAVAQRAHPVEVTGPCQADDFIEVPLGFRNRRDRPGGRPGSTGRDRQDEEEREAEVDHRVT